MKKEELYQSIIKKYPEYSDYSADEVVDGFIKKYPIYQTYIDTEDLGPKDPILMDKVFGIPSAAVRSAIQGKGYTSGAYNYKDVPKFQDMALDAYYNRPLTEKRMQEGPLGKAVAVAGGMVPSAVGFAADEITNPATSIIALAGGLGAKALSKTKLGKVLNADVRDLWKDMKINRAKNRFGNLRKVSGKAQSLADDLYAQVGKAKTNAGEDLRSYIDKNYDYPVSESADIRYMDEFKNLPDELMQEILNSPQVRKTANTYGQEQIKPTLGNMQAIRDIVREDVPTRYWKPKKLVNDPRLNDAEVLYESIGKIQRAANEGIGPYQESYGKVAQSAKELQTKLKTPSGFTKSKPILRMFNESAEGAPLSAVEEVGKYNPDIYLSMDKARKFGNEVTRNEMIKKYLPWTVGGVYGVNEARKMFGSLGG